VSPGVEADTRRLPIAVSLCQRWTCPGGCARKTVASAGDAISERPYWRK